jgi:hypothetical protein
MDKLKWILLAVAAYLLFFRRREGGGRDFDPSTLPPNQLRAIADLAPDATPPPLNVPYSALPRPPMSSQAPFQQRPQYYRFVS